jgi:hypothetical protein
VGSKQQQQLLLVLVLVVFVVIFLVVVVSCAPLALTETHEVVPNRRYGRFHDDDATSRHDVCVFSPHVQRRKSVFLFLSATIARLCEYSV